MFRLLTALAFALLSSSALADVSVQFQVTANALPEGATLALRGNLPPLSWEKDYPLTASGNGIFTASVPFTVNDPTAILEYKLVQNGSTWELDGLGNRLLPLVGKQATAQVEWNVPKPLSEEQLTAMEAVQLSPEQLQADFAVLRQALEVMHPGLYKYNTTSEMDAHFAKLQANWQQPRTILQTYLDVARLLPLIKCGHTFVSPYNQQGLIEALITNRNNKLPLTFRIIEGRMLVQYNASADERLQRGVEIVAINGVPAAEVLESLMPYSQTDGDNIARKYRNMELLAIGDLQQFDCIFPLLFPPIKGQYSLSCKDLRTNAQIETRVKAVTATQRLETIAQRNPGAIAASINEMWQYELVQPNTALLTLGTFSIWRWEGSWQKWLDDCFADMRKNNVQHLLIDIRDNGGGADEVGAYLATKLTQHEIEPYDAYTSYVSFTEMPEALAPHASTWDNPMPGIRAQVTQESTRCYVVREPENPTVLKPAKKPFAGRAWLLISPTNSSATFYLAMQAHQSKLATLVGEETGGSQQGINGGHMYFVTLPNSAVTFDLPIFGNRPKQEMPKGGQQPDIEAPQTVADYIAGRDTAIQTVLKAIDAANGN